MEKAEKRSRTLLTDNRQTTIDKRETSFEGLCSSLENGEDGIYNLIHENKNTIFQPKIQITQHDKDTIPALKQLCGTIDTWEAALKTAQGRDAYTIKKALIQMRREQYLIKSAYQKPVILSKISHGIDPPPLDSSYTFDSEGYVQPHGISLCSPKVCSAILCNYSKLKEGADGDFLHDLWFLLESFDSISLKALEPYPLYKEIVIQKIDGTPNLEIQKILQEKFGVSHSLEYISSLWRKKIPNLIASAAEDATLYTHYLNTEPGKYKKCSRCGQIKLAHNKYFSKNKTSRDGYYSICKKCRNTKDLPAALGLNPKKEV